MRKIVAGLFISLDGVVESPDKFVSPYFSDDVGQAVQSAVDEADTILLGRKTYEEWAAYWPGKTAKDDPFADYINGAPKVVVSTTLTSVTWQNTTLIKTNIKEELTKLKERDGKNIGMSGSGTLVRSLLRDGLLDELRLLLFPIVVGSGQRLFDDAAARIPLKLADSHALSSGVVALTYVPAGS